MIDDHVQYTPLGKYSREKLNEKTLPFLLISARNVRSEGIIVGKIVIEKDSFYSTKLSFVASGSVICITSTASSRSNGVV